MWVWLFDTFFGRVVFSAVFWIVLGLFLSDDPNRAMSRLRAGKVRVTTVLKRVFLVGSIPAWLVFLLFGFPIIELPGQIKSEWGHPIQTNSGYVIDIIFCFCVWYTGWMGSFALLMVVHTGFCNWLWRNDTGYQAWRQAGGQITIDSLEWPYNTDSDQARNSIPPSPPPSVNCPNCQGELTLSNGFQCGNCGVYWDGQQWWSPPPTS